MSEEQPRRRWDSGFLWGCLTPILIVGLLVVGAIVYAGYYMTLGYKKDASLQTILAAVQSNPVARAALGDHIEVSGIPTYNFRYDANGHSATYVFSVQGSRAQGSVGASVVISGGQTQIKILSLTGPDGHIYNLIGGAGPAPTNAVWLLRKQFPRQAQTQSQSWHISAVLAMRS